MTRGPTLKLPDMRSGSVVTMPSDAEVLAANFDRIAGLRLEPEARVLGQMRHFGRKTSLSTARPVTGPGRRRTGRRAGSTAFNVTSSGSGEALEDTIESVSVTRVGSYVPLRQTLNRGVLLSRGLAEDADGNIGRHERSRFAQQHGTKRLTEAAHARQRPDSSATATMTKRNLPRAARASRTAIRKAVAVMTFRPRSPVRLAA